MNRLQKVMLEQLLKSVMEWRLEYGNITLDELYKKIQAALK